MTHCDYYEYRSTLFSGKDWCLYQDKEISRDVYKEFCEYYSSSKNCPFKKRESKSTGCFLTTACVKAKNLPDDCYELETLRKFRDSYIKEMPNGEEIIKEYYEMAPRIVKTIENRTNADQTFKKLFTELVEPCVRYIENNQSRKAYELYEETVLNLKREYLG